MADPPVTAARGACKIRILLKIMVIGMVKLTLGKLTRRIIMIIQIRTMIVVYSENNDRKPMLRAQKYIYTR